VTARARRTRLTLSTPSLGITHSLRPPEYVDLRCAFNSLSRDHSPPDHRSRPHRRSRTSPFNSLSRDHFIKRMLRAYRPMVSFQLPLSGSQGLTPQLWAGLGLSTPSLGITCSSASCCDRCRRAFNSLSRDHRALFRDFPALRGFPSRHPFAHLYFPATI